AGLQVRWCRRASAGADSVQVMFVRLASLGFGEESAQRTCGSAAHGLTVRGCATQRVAPTRGAAGAGPAERPCVGCDRELGGPPLALVRYAPISLYELNVRLSYSDGYYSWGPGPVNCGRSEEPRVGKEVR